MKKRIRIASQATRAVHFELTAPKAKQVFIAGSFNEWRTNAFPMLPLPNGKWAKDVTLTPGRYEYLFVVDDAWVLDPAAAETVPNPFSGRNAVVVVPAQGN